MAIKRTVFCDRCGAEVTNRPGIRPWRGSVTVKNPKIRLFCHWDRNDPYAYIESEYELCKTCYEELRLFLDKK